MSDQAAAGGILPVNGIPCACVVVEDHAKAMAAFARLFGIARWRVERFDGKGMDQALYSGQKLEASWISARGDNGRVAYELVEPTGGDSLFSRHYEARGAGMFGLQSAISDETAIDAAAAAAQAAGIGVLQTCSAGQERTVWLDSWAALGAVIVLRGGAGAKAQAVDMSAEVAKGQPLRVEKHYHFGIVCRDRDATKAAYQRLYGMAQWIEFKIETGVTMSDTLYYGRPVNHAYDNWVGRRDGFAVELIEMRYGEAVYQEMLDTIGDGLHHVFPTICSPQEFAAATKRFAEEGMPIIQSGRIDGLIDYFYVDGRAALAGLTIEVVTGLSDNWLEVMLPGEAAFVLIGPPVE